MTPSKKALEIYITLYKNIGCEAKSKQTGRYMLKMFKEYLAEECCEDQWGYWVDVESEFNKL